jgi:hypothetical protein
MRWCFFRVSLWLNDLLHTLQQNGLSPLCMHRCLFRSLCRLNDLLQTSQQNDLSPLCMCRWDFRWPCWLNDLLHTSQLNNGRSPLRMHWYSLTLLCWLNDSPCSSQEYRRSSPCADWSSFKVPWKKRGITWKILVGKEISLKAQCSEMLNGSGREGWWRGRKVESGQMHPCVCACAHPLQCMAVCVWIKVKPHCHYLSNYRIK